jgi:hypothetical protein
MNKNELKKVLKPLIKECIKEVIFEDGTLSGIVTEVARGLNNSQNTTLMEAKPKQNSNNFNKIKKEIQDASNIHEHLAESRKKLEGSTGLKGVFEGIQPMSSGGQNKSSGHGALSGMDPSDPGVDITGIMNIAGGAWDQLK